MISGSALVLRQQGGSFSTSESSQAAMQHVFDWAFLPGSTLELRPVIYISAAGTAPIVLRAYTLKDFNTGSPHASWTIPATVGLHVMAPVTIAKPASVMRLWWTMQATGGAGGTYSDLTAYVRLPGTQETATVWHPSHPGNAGLSWGVTEGLFTAGGARQFVMDFDQFGGRTVSVSLAGYTLYDAGVIYVKVGGTWGTVSGTNILTVTTSPTYDLFGSGVDTTGNASFTSTWTGPQIVKLTGLKTGNGSGLSIANPTVTFKVV